MAEEEKILLGYGTFSIGGKPVGLTRGGGSFNVETSYREIVADGDMGPVKGRITIDRQVAKLKLNALTAFGADAMKKYYPGLESNGGKTTSNLLISDTDFQEVFWKGKTLDGTTITLKLQNAINMSNIDLTLEDKNEVVPELEFTATYDPDKRTTAPWSVSHGDEEVEAGVVEDKEGEGE